jgi:hypothetical protein
MEISTFELLVKRIAPTPPVPPEIARRVVQGYFLTITNLESKDLTFRIEFFISKPDPADPDRTLFGNVEVFYDIAGANKPITLLGGVNSNVFSGSFVLSAGQTASVQLLPKPSLFFDPNNPNSNAPKLVNPDFEVRGYVTLRLPVLGPFGNQKPQSDTPVKVLINPEIRGTFLPNSFSNDSAEDFDQINYPLAIATGKALNEIAPDDPNDIGSLA